MYKVFVTDDEIVIREGIRNSIAWQDSSFVLVGEAPDGEIALPAIRDEKPDILITDIRMPFMDGMKLCEEVRRAMPWIQIIILSGFDDFNYAQQAINLGVQEYLLKPINSSKLKQALDRIALRIDKEQRERSDQERLRQQLATGKMMLHNQLIGNMLLTPMNEEEGKMVREQLCALGSNLLAACYAVIEFRKMSEQIGYSTIRAALTRLELESHETVFLCGNENSLSALVLCDNEHDIEERVYSFASSALDELDRTGCSDIRISIGDTVTRFCDIYRSYQSARHTRHVMERYPASVRQKRIVGVHDIVEDTSKMDINLDIQPLFDRMKYARKEDVKDQLLDYVSSLQAVDAYISIAASYLRAEVLMTAFRIIKEAKGDPHTVLDQSWLEDESFMTGASIETYVPSALNVLYCAIEYRDANGRMKGNPVIHKARQYVEKNYADSNLTFQNVVDFVAMSGSHFSTVFSQEMGITFTEYLTNLRMSRAKELLQNTSMRSSEIAYAVGYNDPHYFSYLFRKNVGMTPSDFRAAQAP